MKKKGSYLNLEVAFQQAAEKFARLDPAAAARQAGCTYHSEGCLEVPFLNQDYRSTRPPGKPTSAAAKPLSITILSSCTTWLPPTARP
ncbi:MAG TPA: hypothetical protein PKO38_06595 [Bacillota bacterium]|mgnify:CR=1 FL=1|nr:hypothetical protein [Bacillota bacterium]